MKKLLIISIFSSVLFAQVVDSNKKEQDNIENLKSKILLKIEERILKLEKSKLCIKAAKDKKDLMACRPKKNIKKPKKEKVNEKATN